MKMKRSAIVFSLFILFIVSSDASTGDRDPVYRSCVEKCQKGDCIEDLCFDSCKQTDNSASGESPKAKQCRFHMQWKEWECTSECRYHCMVKKESEKLGKGEKPEKYHGKWPFRRVFGLQEPASVAFSLLNLIVHLKGWLSFLNFVYYKLPLTPKNKKTYYEFTGLWTGYAILSMNSWLWSAVFHARDVDITEKLDYSSAVALLGYSLIVAILRVFSVKDEAARVMVAAPFIAFVSTHILYLNFYQFDYGLNMKVCVVMGVAQLLLWAIWAGVTSHTSRFKLWTVVIGGGLAMLLEIYDFPPIGGYLDAHAVWHATTVPLTFIWWSFIKDDAESRTSKLVSSFKDRTDRKKAQ